MDQEQKNSLENLIFICSGSFVFVKYSVVTVHSRFGASTRKMQRCVFERDTSFDLGRLTQLLTTTSNLSRGRQLQKFWRRELPLTIECKARRLH